MIKKLKELMAKVKTKFCRHNWKLVYVYRVFGEFKCTKCGKNKKDWAL
jgi:hypothetical protein